MGVGLGQVDQFVDHVGEPVATTRVGIRPGQLPHLIHPQVPAGERLVAHRHLSAQPGRTHPLGHRGIGDPDRRFHPRAHRHVTVVAEQLPAISGGDDRRGLRLQRADRPLHLPQPGCQRPPVEGLEVIPAARLRALQRTHVPEYDQGVSHQGRLDHAKAESRATGRWGDPRSTGWRRTSGPCESAGVAELLPPRQLRPEGHRHRFQLADRSVHLPQPRGQRAAVERIDVGLQPQRRRLQRPERVVNRTHVPEYDQEVSARRRGLRDPRRARRCRVRRGPARSAGRRR